MRLDEHGRLPAGIEIGVPAAARQPIDTIVKLELDGPAASIPVVKPA